MNNLIIKFDEKTIWGFRIFFISALIFFVFCFLYNRHDKEAFISIVLLFIWVMAFFTSSLFITGRKLIIQENVILLKSYFFSKTISLKKSDVSFYYLNKSRNGKIIVVYKKDNKIKKIQILSIMMNFQKIFVFLKNNNELIFIDNKNAII